MGALPPFTPCGHQVPLTIRTTAGVKSSAQPMIAMSQAGLGLVTIPRPETPVKSPIASLNQMQARGSNRAAMHLTVLAASPPWIAAAT